ncbi:MAG TPA: DinB family protein [Vicinamibacterales bacterium]|jgi:uncharacterized damage-inducible protein DinB
MALMNPYQDDLGDRDPIAALAETPWRIRAIVSALTPTQLHRSYAPGKWTAAQLLIHLAHVELAFGVRARMALTTDHYVIQPFEQDAWMAREPMIDARAALAAYEGLRAMNLALFRSLTPEERARPVTHPERGTITPADIFAVMAGHELHHVPHFELIARNS